MVLEFDFASSHSMKTVVIAVLRARNSLNALDIFQEISLQFPRNFNGKYLKALINPRSIQSCHFC